MTARTPPEDATLQLDVFNLVVFASRHPVVHLDDVGLSKQNVFDRHPFSRLLG